MHFLHGSRSTYSNLLLCFSKPYTYTHPLFCSTHPQFELNPNYNRPDILSIYSPTQYDSHRQATISITWQISMKCDKNHPLVAGEGSTVIYSTKFPSFRSFSNAESWEIGDIPRKLLKAQWLTLIASFLDANFPRSICHLLITISTVWRGQSLAT